MYVVHLDSDVDSRTRVRAALPAGMTYEGVDDIGEAVRSVRKDPVDCLIVGHDGSRIDCLAVLERVREVAPSLPVVVYAGDGSEALAGEAVAAGADGYVPKPDPATLADRVTALFDGSDARANGSPRGASDRHALLFEQSPLAVIEWDLDFRVVSWNPAAEELFGYDVADALGQFGTDLLVPDDQVEAVESAWRRLIAEGEPDHGVNDNLRADGSRITCEWYNAPLLEDGEVVAVLSFARDVTDRQRRSRTLESLQVTASELMRTESREAIAETAVAAARDVLGHPMAAVRLYDPVREVLALAALSDPGHELLASVASEPLPIGPGDDVLWTVYETGDPRVIDHLDPEQSVYGERRPVASLAIQPLGDHGVLSLGATEPAAFDETERRLASILATTVEAALDRAEREGDLQRYETIVQAAGDAVFVLDEDGRFVEANDRFIEMTGHDRDRLVGSSPADYLDDADLERAREQVDRLVDREAAVVTFEAEFECADGDRIPVEVSQSRLPGDEFQGTVGTARDITERKRMERELRDRKHKIEALHEVAERLEACDTEAEICEVAVEAAESILAFHFCILRVAEGDELVTRAISSDAVESESRLPADAGLIGDTYRSGETNLVDDTREDPRTLDRDWDVRAALSVPVGDRGVIQAVSNEVGAFDPDDAELAELLASHTANALDRVAFQEQLRAERDRLAALFDNVPDSVVSTVQSEEEAIVRDVNPAFEAVFGYEAEELVGENVDEYIVPPDERAGASSINERVAAGEIVEREVRRRTANGLRDFMLTAVPVDLGEDSPISFGVYTDVTERKQRRKRVEVLNRVLRHDLRNGMNIVRGSAELLAEQLDDGCAHHAETILARAEELLALAERTRAIERSLDRDERTTGPVDLVEVVERTVSDLAASFPGAEIDVDVPENAVVAGEDLLEFAIYDVVENALVHNDRSSPRVEVTLRRDDHDDAFVFSVADDGPGIPEEERRLLTDDREITQLHHASGLGLWLVNWAVVHSGGDLTFTDNDPRGSVVTIRLPTTGDEDVRELAVEE